MFDRSSRSLAILLMLLVIGLATGCDDGTGSAGDDVTSDASGDGGDTRDTASDTRRDASDDVERDASVDTADTAGDAETDDTRRDATDTAPDTRVAVDGDTSDSTDVTDATDVPSCQTGEHLCDGSCVSDDSPEHCGAACSPCPTPLDGTATCDGSQCGIECDDGFHACDGACIPESTFCGGTAIPSMCSASSDCGQVAECIDSTCVCAEGYRDCAAGCCPASFATDSIAGVSAADIEMEFGADGTAYIFVKRDLGSDHQLDLYTRPPGGTLAKANLSLKVAYDDETFDFDIRDDGKLFVALAETTGESVAVLLHEWDPSTEMLSTSTIGGGYGYGIGIGLDIDPDQTVWVSWSAARNGGLAAYSLAADGTARTLPTSAFGESIYQSDVEYAPVVDGVYSFWGHRYTGNFVSGIETLEGMDLSEYCPADDAEFDSQGRIWSVYDSYSDIDTHFCFDGDITLTTLITARGTVRDRFDRPRIAVDGEDTAFVTTYVDSLYEAQWYASRDGDTWSRGELPTRYGLPDGSVAPGRAVTAGARAPSGRVSFVVAPEDETMGPMVLADLAYAP